MKKILKYKYFLFCFILSFVILLFTSKNSFLYLFNDWVDANAFFTVGKGIFNGVIPYKDLFEQKGPLLYLIYGIGYLFSNTSFHGVYILEVISFSVFLYFIHKIVCLYFNEKYSLFILPFIAFIITTSYYFVHGGSCEEFCLPYVSISLYYFIRHFKYKKLSNFEIFLNGLMAGIVFMMKYTILGFWIGFVIFLIIDYLLNKKFKNALIFCVIFLIGMMIPFLLCTLYFLIVCGIGDFFNQYFFINIFLYKNNENFDIFTKFVKIFETIYHVSLKNGMLTHILIMFMPIFILFSKEKNKLLKIGLIGLLLFTSFFIYYGLLKYKYYFLPLMIFIIISVIYILLFFKKYIDKIIHKKIMYVVFILCFIVFSYFSYRNSNYKEYMKYTKNDYFQYKYSDYINKYDKPTVLNMGSLDVGVYTLANIVPNTKFFQYNNINHKRFPDNIDYMYNCVKNGKTMFIVYVLKNKKKNIPGFVYDNYEMVYSDNFKYEGKKFKAYLFQRKDIIQVN